jgi:hypothetical protein
MVKGDIAIPPNLTELYMDINDDVTNSAIALALHHLPHLRSLRLPQCTIHDSSLLPATAQLTSLTLFDISNIDKIVLWINQLPALSDLRLRNWSANTARQLFCHQLRSFQGGKVDKYPWISSIFEHHKQLQQLSMYIDSNEEWPSLAELPSLSSLCFTCEMASLATYHISRLTSISLCELQLWNARIPIESWNLMTSLIWPNLTMMDITKARDNDDKRSLEWMTAAMNSIAKMIHIRHITIMDDHPTSTFIRMIASISHVMHLHISQLYIHNGEAVRDRGGTLSFSLPHQGDDSSCFSNDDHSILVI